MNIAFGDVRKLFERRTASWMPSGGDPVPEQASERVLAPLLCWTVEPLTASA